MDRIIRELATPTDQAGARHDNTSSRASSRSASRSQSRGPYAIPAARRTTTTSSSRSNSRQGHNPQPVVSPQEPNESSNQVVSDANELIKEGTSVAHQRNMGKKSAANHNGHLPSVAGSSSSTIGSGGNISSAVSTASTTTSSKRSIPASTGSGSSIGGVPLSHFTANWSLLQGNGSSGGGGQTGGTYRSASYTALDTPASPGTFSIGSSGFPSSRNNKSNGNQRGGFQPKQPARLPQLSHATEEAIATPVSFDGIGTPVRTGETSIISTGNISVHASASKSPAPSVTVAKPVMADATTQATQDPPTPTSQVAEKKKEAMLVDSNMQTSPETVPLGGSTLSENKQSSSASLNAPTQMPKSALATPRDSFRSNKESGRKTERDDSSTPLGSPTATLHSSGHNRRVVVVDSSSVGVQVDMVTSTVDDLAHGGILQTPTSASGLSHKARPPAIGLPTLADPPGSLSGTARPQRKSLPPGSPGARTTSPGDYDTDASAPISPTLKSLEAHSQLASTNSNNKMKVGGHEDDRIVAMMAAQMKQKQQMLSVVDEEALAASDSQSNNTQVTMNLADNTDHKRMIIERIVNMSGEAAMKFLEDMNSGKLGRRASRRSSKHQGQIGHDLDDDGKSIAASTSSGESSQAWRVGTMANSMFNKNKGHGGVANSAVEPFVSNLALKSFQLTSHDEPVVRPVHIDAAVLFVDMTGYSKVAKALESKGAFALFDTVNGYLTKIIALIVKYEGEVIKFAGDAILCLWYGHKRKNTCRAAQCALQLQEECPEYPVEGTDLSLKLHIGLVAGEIISSVFASSNVKNMENHFHLIRGECLKAIGDVVDTAKAGEVCISKSTEHLLCPEIYKCCVKDEANPDVLLMKGVPIEEESSVNLASSIHKASGVKHLMCSCVPAKVRGHHSKKRSSLRKSGSRLAGSMNGSVSTRPDTHPTPTGSDTAGSGLDEQDLEGFNSSDSEEIEEESYEEDWERRPEHMQKFIHPGVRRKLRQGLLQSQMAEMRLLTILFIHKTDETIDVDDWFTEVQKVLDLYRCPILQVIDDDKGVHLVAAINLFFADREPAVTGLRLAKALVERKSGCTVGMACDVTFCGVVGSSSACRWDVTGAACVRACRLMQYGVNNNEPVVIGQSVLHYAQDDSLTLPMGETMLKGSPEPVKLFRLADVDTRILSAITSATRFSSAVHVPQFSLIQREVINKASQQRGAVLVHGPTGSGKSYLCVRSVFQTGFVPIMHVAVENARQLDILGTVCEWFKNHKDPHISQLAEQGLDALQLEHNIRALSLALQLINYTIKEGMKTAFIVRQAQCIDTMSCSFVRQVLQSAKTEGSGRVLFFMTIVPQNGFPSWSSVMSHIGGRAKALPLEVGRLDNLEASSLIEHRFGWRCEKPLQDAIVDISGNVAGCIDAAIDYLSRAEPPKVHVSKTGIVHASEESLHSIRHTAWTTISPSVCAKSSQLIDALPTSSKTLLKVIAVLHTNVFPILKSFAVAVTSQLLTTVMPDKVNKDIASLLELSILGTMKSKQNLVRLAPTMIGMDEAANDDTTALVFQSPALLDVVKSITLPVQFKQVSMFAAKEFDNYDLHTPHHFFAKAQFFFVAGNEADCMKCFAKGSALLRKLKEEPARQAEMLKLEDQMVDVLRSNGKSVEVITERTGLKSPVRIPSPLLAMDQLPPHIVAIKDFIPPLSLGFLTHALRQTALCIRTLCVDAGAGVTTPNAYLVEVRQFVNVYCKFVKQIDKMVGFEIGDHLDLDIFEDERALIVSWIQNADYVTVCGFGHSYKDYMDTVVAERVKKVHQYVEENLGVPPRPSDKPFWDGPERSALEKAMANCIEKWKKGDHVSAVRDGLMEMATQGWLPRNPDLTLEFQRDCYLRKRNLPIFCFISFLYVNLSLSWI